MTASDIRTQHWTLRLLPAGARPYGRLMRLDRPIGWWLLLFPCLWSLALAWTRAPHDLNLTWLVISAALFWLGAVVMRGAGCVVNDLWDRDFDRKVARTADRPLASGEVSEFRAFVFLGLLLLAGLAILQWFNVAMQLTAIASLALVVLYPLAKRVTYWPQFVLGLTFNWGALLGWIAVTGYIDVPTLALYAGCLFWTLAYDSIYAHQDKEDDAIVGVKSSALAMGSKTKPVLVLFTILFWSLWTLAAVTAGAGLYFHLTIDAAALVFLWQLWRVELDNPESCLHLFKQQRVLGWLLLAGALLANF